MNLIAIPARLASTRLKEKLLLPIGNKSIIEHTYTNACKSSKADKVVILVDSLKMFNHCRLFTQDVFMTSSSHISGTERIAEFVFNNDNYTNILNVQGDEPFLSYDYMDLLFENLEKGERMVTLGYKSLLNASNPNNVKIITDIENYAMYFSRSKIPFVRESGNKFEYLFHVGVYGYSKELLLKSKELKDSLLESIEKLEQLKFLENGVKIKVVILKGFFSIGIDTMDDYNKALKYYNDKTA